MIQNVMEVRPVLEGQAAAAETIDFIRRLVRIDTTNPPGNELPAVLAIKEILEQNGFPEGDIQILESAPGRANLVARLRGDGSKRPFLMSGHVDVVPVEREHWSHDPFGAEIDQGCIWGRGTMDMKGFVGMYLETFLQAFRQQCTQGGLKRDLIFAAIADEEQGFTHGSKYLVKEHRPLIEAEYGMTEGGAMTVYLGKLRAYPIQVAEKGVAWLRMTAEGEPGHGSMPHTNNSVQHLARAIDRLRRAGHGPVHLTPTFLQMVSAIGKQAAFPLNVILGLLHNPVTAGWLVGVLPPDTRRMFMPMIINTVTPTVLKAGSKTNVIPSVAEAHLDCRVLPGQTVEDVKREILSITGECVKLEPILTSQGTQFPTDNELYKLMASATREMDPEGIVMPFLMMGATDASAYQSAGIKMYGFTPGMLPKGISLVKMAHGHDERIPLQYIETGLPVLWKVVNGISR